MASLLKWFGGATKKIKQELDLHDGKGYVDLGKRPQRPQLNRLPIQAPVFQNNFNTQNNPINRPQVPQINTINPLPVAPTLDIANQIQTQRLKSEPSLLEKANKLNEKAKKDFGSNAVKVYKTVNTFNPLSPDKTIKAVKGAYNLINDTEKRFINHQYDKEIEKVKKHKADEVFKSPENVKIRKDTIKQINTAHETGMIELPTKRALRNVTNNKASEKDIALYQEFNRVSQSRAIQQQAMEGKISKEEAGLRLKAIQQNQETDNVANVLKPHGALENIAGALINVGTYNLPNLAANTGLGLAQNLQGIDNKTIQGVGKDIKNVARPISKFGITDNGFGDVNTLAPGYDLLGQLAQSAPQTVLYAHPVTRALATTGIAGQIVDENVKELMKQGYSRQEALQRANPNAIAQATVEQIGNKFALGGAGKYGTKVLEKAGLGAVANLSRPVAKYGAGFVGEGSEEAIQQYLNNLTVNKKDINEGVAQSFGMGGLMGTGTQVALNVATRESRAKIRQKTIDKQNLREQTVKNIMGDNRGIAGNFSKPIDPKAPQVGKTDPTYYHGGTPINKDSIRNSDLGYSVSADKNVSKWFTNTKNGGSITEHTISPDAKILSSKDIPQELVDNYKNWLDPNQDLAEQIKNAPAMMKNAEKKIVAYARSKGYDAIDMRGEPFVLKGKGMLNNEAEVRVLNPDILDSTPVVESKGVDPLESLKQEARTVEKYPGLVDEIMNSPNARVAQSVAEQRGISLELSDSVLNVMKNDRKSALDIINSSATKPEFRKNYIQSNKQLFETVEEVGGGNGDVKNPYFVNYGQYGEKTGRNLTVEFPKSKDGGDIRILDAEDGQLMTIPYDSAVKIYGTTDQKTLANKIVNGNQATQSQPPKTVAPVESKGVRVTDTKKALAEGFMDIDTADPVAVRGVFDNAGYVDRGGYKVHPDVDPRWVDDLSPETRQLMADEGITYIDASPDQNASAMAVKKNLGGNEVKGISVNSKKDAGLFTNKDPIIAHEIGHHKWNQLSPAEKAEWGNRPAQSEYGKRIEAGHQHSGAMKGEEEFAEQFAAQHTGRYGGGGKPVAPVGSKGVLEIRDRSGDNLISDPPKQLYRGGNKYNANSNKNRPKFFAEDSEYAGTYGDVSTKGTTPGKMFTIESDSSYNKLHPKLLGVIQKRYEHLGKNDPDYINVVNAVQRSGYNNHTLNGEKLSKQFSNEMPEVFKQAFDDLGIDYIRIPGEQFPGTVNKVGHQTEIIEIPKPKAPVESKGVAPSKGNLEFNMDRYKKGTGEEVKVDEVAVRNKKINQLSTKQIKEQLQKDLGITPETTQRLLNKHDRVALINNLYSPTNKANIIKAKSSDAYATGIMNKNQVVNDKVGTTKKSEVLNDQPVENQTEVPKVANLKGSKLIAEFTKGTQKRIDEVVLPQIEKENFTYEEMAQEIQTANREGTTPRPEVAKYYKEKIRPFLDKMLAYSGKTDVGNQGEWYLPQINRNQIDEKIDVGGSIISSIDAEHFGFADTRKDKTAIEDMDMSPKGLVRYATQAAAYRARHEVNAENIVKEQQKKNIEITTDEAEDASKFQEEVAKELTENAQDAEKIARTDVLGKFKQMGEKLHNRMQVLDKGPSRTVRQLSSGDRLYEQIKYTNTRGEVVTMFDGLGLHMYRDAIGVGNSIHDEVYAVDKTGVPTTEPTDTQIMNALTEKHKDTNLSEDVKNKIISKAVRNIRIIERQQENSERLLTAEIRHVFEQTQKTMAREVMTQELQTIDVQNKQLYKLLNLDARRMLLLDRFGKTIGEKITDATVGTFYRANLGYNIRSAMMQVLENKRTVAYFGVRQTAKAMEQATTDISITKRYGLHETHFEDLGEYSRKDNIELTKRQKIEKYSGLMYLFQKGEQFKDATILHAFENKGKKAGLTGTELTEYTLNNFHKIAIKYGQFGSIGLNKSKVGRLLFQYMQYPIKDLTIQKDMYSKLIGSTRTASERREAAKYLARLNGTNLVLYLLMNSLIGASWEEMFGLFNPLRSSNYNPYATTSEKVVSSIPGGPLVDITKDMYMSMSEEFRQAKLEERDFSIKNVANTDRIKKDVGGSIIPGSTQLINKTGIQAALPDDNAVRKYLTQGQGEIQRTGYNKSMNGTARWAAPTNVFDQARGYGFGPYATQKSREYYGGKLGSDLPVIGKHIGRKQAPISDRFQKKLEDIPKDSENKSELTNKLINRARKVKNKDIDRAQKNPTQDSIYKKIIASKYNPDTKKRENDVLSPEKWKLVDSDKTLKLFNRLKKKAENNHKDFGDEIDPIYDKKYKDHVKQIMKLRSMDTGDDKELSATYRREQWFKDYEADHSAYITKLLEKGFETSDKYGDSKRKKDYIKLSAKNPTYSVFKSSELLEYERLRDLGDKDVSNNYYSNNADLLTAEYEARDKAKFEWTNKMRALENAKPIPWEVWQNETFGFNEDELSAGKAIARKNGMYLKEWKNYGSGKGGSGGKGGGSGKRLNSKDYASALNTASDAKIKKPKGIKVKKLAQAKAGKVKKQSVKTLRSNYLSKRLS